MFSTDYSRIRCLLEKPDPELTRLNQYRALQEKFEKRSASELSNEEFLRASNIRVEIDYDIAGNFDRIVELINRTNQLNYTKNRLETPESVDEFREQMNGFGYYAGCVARERQLWRLWTDRLLPHAAPREV